METIEPYEIETIEPRVATDLEIANKEIEELKERLEKADKEKDRYYDYYMEYMSRALKYEHAFKALFEEVRKK